MPEPLQAHHHHVRRRLALRYRQPLRARRRREEEALRQAEPVRLQVQALLRLPQAHRQEGHPRRDRHPSRAQHVRELPVLVHAAHLARLQGDDLRPQLARAVRDRHRIDRLREHLLPGQAGARPHQVAAGQGRQEHLLPVRELRGQPRAQYGQPLQLPGRGQLPGGDRREHARTARGRHPLHAPVLQPRQPRAHGRPHRRGVRVGEREPRGGRDRGQGRVRRGQDLQERRAGGRFQGARLHEGAQLPGHRARRTPVPHRPRGQPRHPRDDLRARHGRALGGFDLRTAARGEPASERLPVGRRGGPAQEERERLPPRRRPQGDRLPHAAARHQPVGLPFSALRGGAFRGVLPGSRTRAAQLLRLRPGRHHHRSGGRDPRRQGRRVHAAQDR